MDFVDLSPVISGIIVATKLLKCCEDIKLLINESESINQCAVFGSDLKFMM